MKFKAALVPLVRWMKDLPQSVLYVGFAYAIQGHFAMVDSAGALGCARDIGLHARGLLLIKSPIVAPFVVEQSEFL